MQEFPLITQDGAKLTITQFGAVKLQLNGRVLLLGPSCVKPATTSIDGHTQSEATPIKLTIDDTGWGGQTPAEVGLAGPTVGASQHVAKVTLV